MQDKKKRRTQAVEDSQCTISVSGIQCDTLKTRDEDSKQGMDY